MQTRSKGIIVSYIKIAVNMVCGMVMSSVLLHSLGDVEHGIYQTVSAFANNLILLEFGVGTVMVRNISLCRGRQAGEAEIQRNISTIWTLTCLLSSVLVVFSVFFFQMIPALYSKTMTPEQIQHGQQIFAVISVHVLTNFLLHTVNAVIFSHEDYTFGAGQSILKILLRTGLLIVLLGWFRNALVIAVVDTALGAACLLGSWFYCHKKLGIKIQFGKCDRDILRSALPLAVAIFLQGVVNQANNNVDKFLIGIMLSPETVSLYSIAMYVYSIFCSLVNVASSMYTPAVTQKVSQGYTGRELGKHLIAPCRLTALAGGLILFGFIAVGRQFVLLLYKSEYLLAWPLAVILIFPAYIDAVVDVMVHVLNAMNKRLARSAVLIVSTVFNVVLTVLFLEPWGVFGAAAATAGCTLVGSVLIMNVYYHKVIGVPMLWLFGQAFRGILVYLVVGCGIALVVGNLIENVLLSFLAGGVTFVAVAVGGYFFLGSTAEEKEAIMAFLRKMKIVK